MDGNVKLVHGWAKQTDKNDMSLDELKKKKIVPKPLLSMVSLDKVQCAVTGVPDDKNPIPFSYIFLPHKKMWSDIFSNMMAEKNKK